MNHKNKDYSTEHAEDIPCTSVKSENVRAVILRQWLTVVAVGAVMISLLTVAPPLLHSGFAAGHDAPAHITYTYLFDRALSQGQFPVRWVEWVAPGNSQP